jgi:flagellar biosynthesis protein FliQ
MMDLLMRLYGLAMQTALTLSIPVVAAIACIGVIVSFAQTVVGIQDQNISFGPKIAAGALILAIGGPAAMAVLAQLLRSAIESLPRLTG